MEFQTGPSNIETRNLVVIKDVSAYILELIRNLETKSVL